MSKTTKPDLLPEIDRLKKIIAKMGVVEVLDAKAPPRPPCRAKPPNDRPGYTVKFELYDSSDATKPPKLVKGEFNVGCYENGSPCELFIYFDKAGSKLRGLAEIGAILTSLLFQHGVPLAKVAEKMIGTKFEPSGTTGNPEQPTCTSLFDYIFRYMLRKHTKAVEKVA